MNRHIFKKPNQRPTSGFTFIEMSLVVALLSMVALAVFQAVANGMKIWNRTQQFVIDEDIAILLDKISEDLRNSLNFSRIRFKGKDNKITFPGLIKTAIKDRSRPDEIEYRSQIGAIEYYFDSSKSVIFRRQATYGQTLKKVFDPERPMASDVVSFKLLYYVPEDNKLVEKPKAEGLMPPAVLVQLEFKESTGQIRRVEKLINIPIQTTVTYDESLL